MGIRTLHRRAAVATAVVSALLRPVSVTAEEASTAQVRPARRSTRAPGPAARTARGIKGIKGAPAAASRGGAVDPPVHDNSTGLTCGLASERQCAPASPAKGTLMAATLRRAQELRRALTR